MSRPAGRGRKLTEEDVYAIRADRRPSRQVAVDYDISPASVQKIKDRKLWGHLPEDPERPTYKRGVGRQPDLPHKRPDMGQKLTEEQVKAIMADRRRPSEIARDYGVSRTLISLIRSGKRWGHLRDSA